MPEPLLTRYLQPLLAGRRAECFDLVRTAIDEGLEARTAITDVIWPAMRQIERLFRDDRINTATEHIACRINRTVADQLQARLPRAEPNGKRILVMCADDPGQELGAQMVADLFQADGWDTTFLGGGVPPDEVAAFVGQLRPHTLLIFGTDPTGVPATRQLIELIRDIGACPTMNIVVSGGVFDRADGLWREVGADAFAETAPEVLECVNNLGPRNPTAPRVGLVKKRRRRRKDAPQPVRLATC